MNETGLGEDKYLGINKSIGVMWELNMNTPGALVRNNFPNNQQTREINVSYVKVIAERIKVKVVIPGIKNYKYLEHLDFWDAIKDYNGESITIFRAPKTEPILTGICQPSLHYNKITVHGTISSTFKVLWGESKLIDFPMILHRPIIDLNTMLFRGKEIFDGMDIRFSFHSNGEGTIGDRIVLWGRNFS